jgi:peroxiredoxin Q/BCP
MFVFITIHLKLDPFFVDKAEKYVLADTQRLVYFVRRKGAMQAIKKEVFQNHVTGLKVGMNAPDFQTADETGKLRSLKEFTGKKLILYFYPADLTPTCTEEACNLRDHFQELKKKGYEVIGVSKDEMRMHQKFITKHQLPFHLLADTQLDIIKAYDVWGKKQFMGKIFDGIVRTTFLISEKGVIERIITKVKSKQHTQQVLEEE